MKNYTDAELDEMYSKIAKMLQEESILQKATQKGLPSWMVVYVLADQLGMICIAEGEYRQAGDHFIREAIAQLQSIHSDYISNGPPFTLFPSRSAN